MPTEQEIIKHTKRWIKDVVIGCNFCPFANKVVKQNAVHYEVTFSDNQKSCLETLLAVLKMLDATPSIDTAIMIIPNGFEPFLQYLDLIHLAERLLKKNGYDGIYQIASFHPLYLFAGSKDSDPANYTNRSPYPMLHILREESIDKALEHHANPEAIPTNNIAFAKEKGLAYFQMLRDSCLDG